MYVSEGQLGVGEGEGLPDGATGPGAESLELREDRHFVRDLERALLVADVAYVRRDPHPDHLGGRGPSGVTVGQTAGRVPPRRHEADTCGLDGTPASF